MKDMYSFHTSQADLDVYYDQVMAAYRTVFERLGIGEQTYMTYASGGVFSKFSHEFQTVTPAGEDTIYICAQCRLAINREIRSDITDCPQCHGTDFTETKAIEVGNIFKLGTKYSAPFECTYTDEAGVRQVPVMGCYGIGLTRLLGTIVEVHHDGHGIIWPASVAPFQVHLLNLNKNSVQSDRVYAALQQAGYSVLYDDRSTSAGVKLGDADLLGVPIRLVVSAKTGDQIEVKQRVATATTLMSLDQFIAQHV